MRPGAGGAVHIQASELLPAATGVNGDRRYGRRPVGEERWCPDAGKGRRKGGDEGGAEARRTGNRAAALPSRQRAAATKSKPAAAPPRPRAPAPPRPRACLGPLPAIVGRR